MSDFHSDFEHYYRAVTEAQEPVKAEKPVREEEPPMGVREFLTAFLAWLVELWDALAERAAGLVPAAREALRAHRQGGFPESNSRVIQLFLLLPGLMPMWRSLARERFTGRRVLHVGLVKPVHFTRLRPVAYVFFALICSGVAVFFSVYTTDTSASFSVRPVEDTGARSIAAYADGVATVTLDHGFSFAADSMRDAGSLARRSGLDEAALEKELSDPAASATYGYSLYIDDDLIGSTQFEGSLEALIERIKSDNMSEDTLTVDFVEDVRISEGYVPTDSLMTLGEISAIVRSTKVGEETYVVVNGDTWGKIAMEHGMNNAELEAMNPGYNIDKINIGDELITAREVPYLTVKVTERQNYVTEVEYETIYVDDPSMYQGDTKVLTAGSYGSADVVADVVYVNGTETERTVISQVMLTEPTPETVARGTKERPSWLPTGSFRWPSSGRVTSGFGHRNTGIRGASTYHQGIDIACAYGSPIYAADGGTVTYTGYKGAMGYTVIIDHGNGYVTYYEHCSSFTCSAGQHVYKGQQIAKVGSSGVASGAHCHFGIQKYGTYVNPIDYLP